eukprot:m.444562 g.444562  ORF g.444562 m.444562 type:complete len:319 (-) comp20299_c3_seq13:139-1095(-)
MGRSSVTSLAQRLSQLRKETNMDKRIVTDVLKELSQSHFTASMIERTKLDRVVADVRKRLAPPSSSAAQLAATVLGKIEAVTGNSSHSSSKATATAQGHGKKKKKNESGSSKPGRSVAAPTNVHETKKVPRRADGTLKFNDFPEFRPNLSPMQVMQMGSFGGTYFRRIKSGVTGETYSKVHEEFPKDWFQGLSIKQQVTAQNYDADVNKYKVKCGASLDEWEGKGWISKEDPYGWFQWYCRFYLGRRYHDDERQIRRWLNCCGPKGRWKNNLIGKCVRASRPYDDYSISPVVRQTLQHWGYQLTQKDYETHAKKLRGK